MQNVLNLLNITLWKYYTGEENNNFQNFNPISNCISNIDKKIQKPFFWKNLTPKIKHKTLCNSFEKGSFKVVLQLY